MNMVWFSQETKIFFPLLTGADKLLSTPKRIAFLHKSKFSNEKSGRETNLTP